jgi:DNA-binding NarL/FixJ family response regulator
MTNCPRENGRNGGIKNRGRLKGWQPHTTARRAIVAKLMAEGLGLSAIARKTGMRADTVRNDLRAIRYRPEGKPNDAD